MEEPYSSNNPWLWQQEGYAYFGEHAFPLACQWLYAKMEPHQADEAGMYSSFLALEHIPRVYLTMLGMPLIMLQLNHYQQSYELHLTKILGYDLQYMCSLWLQA